MPDRMICVELVCAEADSQTVLHVQLPEESTVADAISVSDIAQRLSFAEPLRDRLGIFGKRVALEHILEDGDRIEIYRPLLCNPMEARRRRARDP